MYHHSLRTWTKLRKRHTVGKTKMVNDDEMTMTEERQKTMKMNESHVHSEPSYVIILLLLLSLNVYVYDCFFVLLIIVPFSDVHLETTEKAFNNAENTIHTILYYYTKSSLFPLYKPLFPSSRNVNCIGMSVCCFLDNSKKNINY